MQSQARKAPLEIAVLGGGISGLAAAYWLTRLIPIAAISLYEKQDRLGGLIGTQSVRGRLLETGPLAFPSAAPATAEIMAGCGLGELCEPIRRDGWIGLWGGRKIVPFSRTPSGILKSGLLSPMTLARLLFEPFIPKGKEADESVAAFFRRRTGRGFLEAIMEPMSYGILAGDPGKMSMAANFPMLFGMERKWGSLARGLWKKGRGAKRKAGSKATDAPAMMAGARGNQAIMDAIAEELRRKGVAIHLSSNVTGIRKSPAGRTELARGNGSVPLSYDAVIACIPSFELAAMLEEADADIDAETKRFLAGIPYASIDLGYLSYRKPDFAGGFGGMGCLVRKRTGMGILSMFMPSRMSRGRCPDDEELVRIMAGGERPKDSPVISDEDIRSLSAHAVDGILGPRGIPIDWTVIRHKDALPQLLTGHSERLAMATARLESAMPGLILAGTAFAGSGIENAVKEGKRAALEAQRRKR